MCSTRKRNGRVLGRRTPGGGPRRGGRDPRPLGHPPRQRRTPGNEPRDIRSISNPTVLHVPRLLAGEAVSQSFERSSARAFVVRLALSTGGLVSAAVWWVTPIGRSLGPFRPRRSLSGGCRASADC